MKIGDAVKEARRRRGLSQKEAAVAAGWSRSKQAHIEAGRNVVTERDRERLAQALGVSFRHGPDGYTLDGPSTSDG
jgi:transcriptional regulator with XRE-family HTH domain